MKGTKRITARALMWAIAALAMITVAGCGEDDISQISGGGGGFILSVDASTGPGTPTYSWTGGNVNSLLVLDGAGNPVWDVISAAGDQLPSPYVHGDTNTLGGVLTFNILSPGTSPLTSKATYTVQVQRAAGATASRVFTMP